VYILTQYIFTYVQKVHAASKTKKLMTNNTIDAFFQSCLSTKRFLKRVAAYNIDMPIEEF
jgi:hypothetical protein